jgi:hypothetical protein
MKDKLLERLVTKLAAKLPFTFASDLNDAQIRALVQRLDEPFDSTGLQTGWTNTFVLNFIARA